MNVVVTGGTGTLGRALVARCLKVGWPVTVYSRDEEKQREMAQEYPCRYIVGDVRDADGVRKAVQRADLVFHCAALKQVPLGETQPTEIVKTNLMGTWNVLRGASGWVVLISSDKACYPTSAYGMSKGIMERLGREAGSCWAISVRLGNILGSRGSVLEVWRKLREQGKPLGITDPRMTRFFMPLDEVVDHIMLAARVCEAGDVYVPKAKALRITDLAQHVRGVGGPPLVTLGMRPGERLHEVLLTEEECDYALETQRYYRLQRQWIGGEVTPYISFEHLVAPRELL